MFSQQDVEATESQESINRRNALSQWKRIILLVIAITVHNIPEGLAVGVSFGAIGTTDSATFETARYENTLFFFQLNLFSI